MDMDIDAPPAVKAPAQEIVLTEEQEAAVSQIIDWVENGHSRTIALAGAAGCGKSVCARVISDRLADLDIQTAITAMTNKAAMVLMSKGIDGAMTMHSATMSPVFKPPFDKIEKYLSGGKYDEYDSEARDEIEIKLLREFPIEALRLAVEKYNQHGIYAALRALNVTDVMQYVIGWRPKRMEPEGAILIDEASMLGSDLIDVIHQAYEYVILVGDEHQLPPVKGSPVFWEIEDRVVLNTVHRQATTSQPYQLASILRAGGHVDMSPVQAIDLDLCREGIPVIVWKNITREKLTRAIRAKLGFGGGPPRQGERLICRNVADKKARDNFGLYNNSVWTVTRNVGGFICDLEGEDGTKIYSQKIHLEEFNTGDGIPFRFAYAMTAHSAQGSEYPGVMIHRPDTYQYYGMNSTEANRFLYTSVTRAKELVLWVNDSID